MENLNLKKIKGLLHDKETHYKNAILPPCGTYSKLLHVTATNVTTFRKKKKTLKEYNNYF